MAFGRLLKGLAKRGIVENFLTELTNKLWEIREWITGGGEKAPDFIIRADAYTSTEEIWTAFEEASKAFYISYLEICK